MPEEKNPLQLKLTPPEGYEYCWIEQMKLCPRGSVVGDKLEPIGPFQLPGTHWKSVSDNRHPELSQYWAFSTMTPNPNVRAIEHYLYKDLILCERPIEHRKAEQDEYNEQLRSFKELSFGKEGASLFSRAEIETLQDHPLLSDPDGKKAKHLEPLLANVDNTLLPLMQNINLMCSDYDAELKRQRILTREDERRIAEETAKRLFDMLKRD
jgi:hypothetical protein